MGKKILNIIELLLIAFAIFGIFGFYQTINSTPRFFTNSGSLRIGIDIVIIATLLIRALQIIKNFKKKYLELGRLKTLEKVVYAIGFISLLPDLTTWYQWNYFANMYLHIFIIYSLPIIFWTIEIIERTSIKSNKIGNYAVLTAFFIMSIIGYTIYVSSMI